MSAVVGRVAPVLAVLLSLVLAGCSLLPGQGGQAAQTPVASPSAAASGPAGSASSGPSGGTGSVSPSVPAVPWGTVGPGWMVVLLKSTATPAATRVVLHSPEGTSYPLADLPADAELWDVTLGVGQILIALPGKTKGAKQLTVLDPWQNSQVTVPGEYTKAQFLQSGEGRLLLRGVGAKNWALVDLEGTVVQDFPDLTGDTVVADAQNQMILGTSVQGRQFLYFDLVYKSWNEVPHGRWDRTVTDCRPVLVYVGLGYFICTQTRDGRAVIARYPVGERATYEGLYVSRRTGQTMSVHLLAERSWAFVSSTSCGGSKVAVGEYWGGKPVRGFDRTTAPFLLQKSGAHVLVSPVCGKPPTRIEVRDYKGGKRLLYTPPEGWTILAAKAMPTFL